MTADRALLVAFCGWFYDYSAGRDETTDEFRPIDADVDAFLAIRYARSEPGLYEWHDLAARQPPGEQTARGIQPMPHPGVLADDLMHAYLSGPECNTPPAPQRFWRVFKDVRGGWCYAVCDAEGRAFPDDEPGRPYRTREQAEADGAASGLPRWPGEGGGR